MATVKDFIKCPKCGKQMMGKSHPQKFGKEYFAHCCHVYFGVNELVNHWNYDAGDLFPTYPVTHADYKNWAPKGNYPYRIDVTPISYFGPKEYDGETGEPFWQTKQERNSSYQMVHRMLLGISEIDDCTDLVNTQMGALQIGLQ